ncbi:MAG: hypothetical protein RLZZ301_1595 [Bacteroidota bacterium]
MKKILFLGCCVCLLSLQADDVSPEFKRLLTRAGMQFELPTGLKIIPCQENEQQNYDLALAANGIEFRYAIRPLDDALFDYQQWKLNPPSGSLKIDPNNLSWALFKTTLLNISGGKSDKFQAFNPKDVKEEFYADWGATAFIPVRGDFAGKHKVCIAITLFRKNKANAYIFILGSSAKKVQKHMMKGFYALKFREI